MIRTIIVDDEARSQNTLTQLLAEYCSQVKLVGIANDVLSGVKAINNHQPDLVFLDIEMPNYSGFQLIEYFDVLNFQIVFTTAYEHHAIRAFHTATGYLLKPINIDELIQAVERVEEIMIRKGNFKNGGTSQSLDIDPTKKIDLPTKNGILYLTINEILYLQADGRNTNIYLKNDTQLVTTLNLKECEKVFFKTTLLRIHKSNMINLEFIKKYVKKLDAYIEMEGGKRLDVGQTFKEQLNKGLSFFSK